MTLRRRGLLTLGGLLVLAPLTASCAMFTMSREGQKIVAYFEDQPHVRGVKDEYNGIDTDNQIIIYLELDDDVTVEDVATLFAEAEPAICDATRFPALLTASWSHNGARMEQCAQAFFNAPEKPTAYDDALVRAGVEGALAAATETVQTVKGGAHRSNDGTRTLSYTVDHGTADALPGDVSRSVPPEMVFEGYDVFLDQKVSVSDWSVHVRVWSTGGSPRAESVPLTDLLDALPHPDDGYIYVGDDKADSSNDLLLGPGSDNDDQRVALRWGEPAVRVLEAARWRGVFVLSLGLERVRFRFDAGDSPTVVLDKQGEADGLGELILERAHS